MKKYEQLWASMSNCELPPHRFRIFALWFWDTQRFQSASYSKVPIASYPQAVPSRTAMAKTALIWFDSQPARYQTEIQEGSIRVSGRKSKIWYGQILPAQSQDIRRLCKYRKKGNIHTHNIKTLTTYQTGKSRCDAVYKESKRYDYLVQRILSAIGKNDKHWIAKVSSSPITCGQYQF